MRAGILTFHRASNFGTALQAFATTKSFEKMGIDAELIDYRPQYIENTLQKGKIQNGKQLASVIVNRIIYGDAQEEKVNCFLKFASGFSVSSEICKTIEDIEKVAQQYDVIVSGSDQLWNENITGNDLAYFFPFKHKNKITYASSFGTESISQKRKNTISVYLKDFKAISVREVTGAALLNSLIKQGIDIPSIKVVPDPTFILSKTEWVKYENKNLVLPSNSYILTYYMIETPLLRKLTKKIREDTGLPVLNIKPSKRQMVLHEGSNYPNIGPAEFLACYNHAAYVITNSFHGTAFAINFGIPFYTAPLPISMAGEVNSRLKDILNMFGLESRWIQNERKIKDIDVTQGINIIKELEYQRKRGFDYIKNAINIGES